MKKLIILITLLLIAGCVQTTQSAGEDIKIEFTQLPSDELYENEEFFVELKVANAGRNDVDGR